MGLVRVTDRADQELPAGEGSAGRLAVSVAAYHAGFYLLDVIEIDARIGVTVRDMARLRSLAVHTDAEGLFVLGLDDDERAVLGPVADELRLVVRVVPGDDDPPPEGGAPPRAGVGGTDALSAGQAVLPGDQDWDRHTLGVVTDDEPEAVAMKGSGTRGAGRPIAVCELLAGDVGRVLAAAMQDDPVMAWLLPDPRERAELLPVVFSWLGLEVFFNDGKVVWLTTEDGSGDTPTVAVALWLDRTAEAGQPVASAAEVWGPLRALGAGYTRLSALTRARDAARPRAEHQYLMVAGVHPAHAGRGLGARLLREWHDSWDRYGIAAYLEAPGAQARGWFAGHGYRDHGEPIVLPDGPTLFPMMRAPEAAREQTSSASPAQDLRLPCQ